MSLEKRIRILETKLQTNPPPVSVPVVIKLNPGEYSWRGQKYASAEDVPGSESGILIIEIEDGRVNKTEEVDGE